GDLPRWLDRGRRGQRWSLRARCAVAPRRPRGGRSPHAPTVRGIHHRRGAMTRCGVVALAGKPNVGKSTLLNALVGEHLAIVSPKPQSTRLPVVGLLTRDDAQFIFTDSPGLLEPEYQLHETMRAAALRAIADAEVIAYLHPLAEFPAPPLTEVAKLDRAPRAPIVTVYTKSDVASTSPNLPQPPPTSSVVVSALTGSGLDQLLAALRERLPEGPFHYDPDAMATQPRSEEHTSELQSLGYVVRRLRPEKN